MKKEIIKAIKRADNLGIKPPYRITDDGIIKVLPPRIARNVMRELLRDRGISYSEVDEICRLIPENASICRITGNAFIGQLPEGEILKNKIKKYFGIFELGCRVEIIFYPK